MEVYPGHGAGSACGTAIGDRRMTTIGNERLFSPALRNRTEDEFVEWILGSLPEPPRHYARLKPSTPEGCPWSAVCPRCPRSRSLSFGRGWPRKGRS